MLHTLRIICEKCKIPIILTFPRNGQGLILDSETHKSIDTYGIIGIISSDKINGNSYSEIGRIRCPFCGNLFDVEFPTGNLLEDAKYIGTSHLVKDEPRMKDPIETRLDSIDHSLAELVKVVKDLVEYSGYTHHEESTKESQDDANNDMDKIMNGIDKMRRSIGTLQKRLDIFHNIKIIERN